MLKNRCNSFQFSETGHSATVFKFLGAICTCPFSTTRLRMVTDDIWKSLISANKLVIKKVIKDYWDMLSVLLKIFGIDKYFV